MSSRERSIHASRRATLSNKNGTSMRQYCSYRRQLQRRSKASVIRDRMNLRVRRVGCATAFQIIRGYTDRQACIHSSQPLFSLLKLIIQSGGLFENPAHTYAFPRHPVYSTLLYTQYYLRLPLTHSLTNNHPDNIHFPSSPHLLVAGFTRQADRQADTHTHTHRKTDKQTDACMQASIIQHSERKKKIKKIKKKIKKKNHRKHAAMRFDPAN